MQQQMYHFNNNNRENLTLINVHVLHFRFSFVFAASDDLLVQAESGGSLSAR